MRTGVAFFFKVSLEKPVSDQFRSQGVSRGARALLRREVSKGVPLDEPELTLFAFEFSRLFDQAVRVCTQRDPYSPAER